jgi:RNA polymerase sigma-70 factor (ECF subfamily)
MYPVSFCVKYGAGNVLLCVEIAIVGERGDCVSDLPDEALARRAAAGNMECFEELLARYRVRVYRLCFRMTGNAEDAEDWTQECFVRVYQHLGSFNAERPFAPWLMRLVSNTCINLGKARARRESRVQVGLAAEEERASSAGDPLYKALASAETQEMQEALASLSPLVRQTIVLWAQEDLTFRELGEILGAPLPTVSARVRRALLHLRERLRSADRKVKP